MLKPPVNKEDHQLGNKNAGIVLAEFGDYECSHCAHAHPLLKRLAKKFEHELSFVFRNFPLREAHPAAQDSAQAAEAAGAQGKFWEMHDLLYKNQEELENNIFGDLAERLNLDIRKFGKDIDSEKIISKIDNDFESGVRSGVNGTPTFFLNGTKLTSYDGTYESLEKEILQHLGMGAKR